MTLLRIPPSPRIKTLPRRPRRLSCIGLRGCCSSAFRTLRSAPLPGLRPGRLDWLPFIISDQAVQFKLRQGGRRCKRQVTPRPPLRYLADRRQDPRSGSGVKCCRSRQVRVARDSSATRPPQADGLAQNDREGEWAGARFRPGCRFGGRLSSGHAFKRAVESGQKRAALAAEVCALRG